MGRDDVGPNDVLVHRGDGRTAFRVVRVAVPTEHDWRSHYEQGRPPHRSEIGSALDHMSLSMFSTPEQARDVTEHFGRRLGSFIAGVELKGEHGIWFSESGGAGHILVWGRPADLQACLVAVEPV